MKPAFFPSALQTRWSCCTAAAACPMAGTGLCGCCHLATAAICFLTTAFPCWCLMRALIVRPIPKKVHLNAVNPRVHLCPYQGLRTPGVQVLWLMQPNEGLFWSQHGWAMPCFEIYSLILHLLALVMQLLCSGPVCG